MRTIDRHREAAPARRAGLLALKERVARLHLDAAALTLPAKVEATARQWLSRDVAHLDADEGTRLAAMAMAMATELESFTPSMSGATAVDRLARQRGLDAADAACRALKGARFSIFKVRAAVDADLYLAEDLASRGSFSYFDEALPPGALGVPLAAQICDLGEGRWSVFGLVLPLDDATLAVAMDFVRPGRGIPHGHRCAAAVYRHIVRHGGSVIAGLNGSGGLLDRSPEDEVEIPSPLDPIASRLVAEDRWREPPAAAVLDEVLRLVSADTVAVCLFKAVDSDRRGRTAFGLVYRRFAEAMIEALHLRALAGSGLERDPLGMLASLLDREVATRGYPRSAADLFREIRLAVAAAKPQEARDDLARVIERIRGLRAKTVDQGCTEEEALAAADKVAELLDRYGLSLGETDLRRQACLGVGIDSNRRRMGPLDDCVPAIAHFCDCRAWNERTPAGTIRSMFFGLPADVEAAQYLVERVATALDTETAAFRRGEFYAGLASGGRQKATTSFQFGLARGICDKLDARKRERETRTFQLTGRDLVPVKADVVAEELARLGLSFTTRAANRGRTVLLSAYEAGQVASGRFEIQSELE